MMKSASVLVVLLLVGLLAAMVGAASDETASTLGPIHNDPEEVEAGLVEAVLGYANGDLERVRRGLASIEAGCKRLEHVPELPTEVTGYDRAFHTAVTRTRELVARGDYDESFGQFFWIQKGCHECHRRAVEHGLREGPASAEDAGE